MKTIKDASEALRWRAAKALDATHAIGERGPKTLRARDVLSCWLDGAPCGVRRVTAFCAWLEFAARVADVREVARAFQK
jgi:hypothetical protein